MGVGAMRHVKVKTDRGWIVASQVRRSGSFDAITLDGEGVMTWAVN